MIRRRIGAIFLLAAFALVIIFTVGLQRKQINTYYDTNRSAKIYPDYCSVVIPPNIAPMNFLIDEQGTYYYVRVYSNRGEPIEVFSRSRKIKIPKNAWHKLLNDNRSETLNYDIYVKNEGQWNKYETIHNFIAKEDIDPYLIYRKMHPTNYHIRGPMGIYQRCLSSFDEKCLIDNRSLPISCLNCHAFSGNKPDKLTLGIRDYITNKNMTLLLESGKVSKIDTKFGYTSWHPSGKIIAYSINKLPIFFHTASNEIRDTFDITSSIAYYDVNKKVTKTYKDISKKEHMETWPVWSSDGQYLYFCTTPITWDKQNEEFPPNGYEKVRYNLVRISYDLKTDQWEDIETVLSASETGKSIAMPRVSPDGKWLTFCLIDYGFFPAWQEGSDIFIMDLNSASEKSHHNYHKMELNSDKSESWHTWSSNSRWIAFSSKKEQGVFTRCYISYVDENGKAYKPFILPQKDPDYYFSRLEAFNTPELVTGPIAITRKQLMNAVNGRDAISVKMPITTATPKTETRQFQDLQTRRE